MARPLRIAYPGALYNITSRGNERRQIFFSDDDRLHFLRLVARVVERFSWICYAYCLMDNHYHLFVETTLANISQGMKHLNGIFAQYINWKHKRVGHLLQGRFDARLIEKETYFMEVSRYVPLNPVRAGICSNAEDYRWSSYRATRGIIPAPAFLTIDPILERFGMSKEESQRRYGEFVASGVKARPFDQLRGGLFLGSEAFIQKFQDSIRKRSDLPFEKRMLLRPPLEQLLIKPDGLQAAAKQYGYSTRAIAKVMGVHQTTIARRLRDAGPGSDPERCTL